MPPTKAVYSVESEQRQDVCIYVHMLNEHREKRAHLGANIQHVNTKVLQNTYAAEACAHVYSLQSNSHVNKYLE